MKKIIGAALAGSMLAGTAFAADLSFSYTGSNYFKSSGGNLKIDERTDCMSVGLSNDVGGVVLDFDTTDGKTLKQDEYYGWMNFGLPAGNLQITAGKWIGRYIGRVNADAGDLDGEDFEMNKPGVVNGTWGKDSDNLTEGNISAVLAYTNSDLLPGALLVKAGLVKSSWDPTAASAVAGISDSFGEDKDAEDSDFIFNSGFVGEVAYRQDGLINLSLAVKSLKAKQMSYGLFVSPLMVENLQALVGFTFAGQNDWSDGKWHHFNKEFGIDLRARYQVTEALSLTTMHNISCFYDKTADDDGTVLWDMFNANFQMAENLAVGCTANFTFDIAKSAAYRSKYHYEGFDLVTSPYLVIQATEKVAVTTAFRVRVDNINLHKDGNEEFDITVPVIFSFSY